MLAVYYLDVSVESKINLTDAKHILQAEDVAISSSSSSSNTAQKAGRTPRPLAKSA